MEISIMQSQLITDFSTNLLHWSKILNNTSPANYGLADENWNVYVRNYDFYIHIQERFVEFRNVTFTGRVNLFESGVDATPYPLEGTFSGEAFFEFDITNQNVYITKIEFDHDSIDLFSN